MCVWLAVGVAASGTESLSLVMCFTFLSILSGFICFIFYFQLSEFWDLFCFEDGSSKATWLTTHCIAQVDFELSAVLCFSILSAQMNSMYQHYLLISVLAVFMVAIP